MFRTLDWQELLRDRAPRRDLVYRRKQDDRSILARGALGFRAGEGVVLPLGLVQGQKITQVLRSATLRVARRAGLRPPADPVPRARHRPRDAASRWCCAPATSRPCCARACRRRACSRPVEIDGRLLVDGGLVDNLPVSLAREMGVDVRDRRGRELPARRCATGLESALDVTNQMIGIMVRRGTPRVAGAARRRSDVLIEPDLGRMTAVDFARCRR